MEPRYLTRTDREDLGRLLKLKAKGLEIFVARKTGGNARGIGENRSVILGSSDKKKWQQVAKLWGEHNEIRAHELVSLFNHLAAPQENKREK